MGIHYTTETDHKPLVPLLNTKDIAKMPPRIQRFHLRLMRYNYNVKHVEGKTQTTADALSRAPVSEPDKAAINLLTDVSVHAKKCIETLPVSNRKIQEVKEVQHSDPETAKVIQYCKSGWPDFMPDLPLMKQYWENRHHLSVIDDLLLFDDRIVIPSALRLDILQRLREGHQGITQTKALASTCVWWPYISSHIETMVNKCATFAIHRPERREPLLPPSFPDRQWSRFAMDLFELKGKTYLIIYDYFSRWIELRLLEKLNSKTTIIQIKSVFATQGIPDIISDNGPQFVSWEFKVFAQEYGFTHVTSPPRYPRSNGEAQKAVRTIKNLLKKVADPYDALLLHRATPLNNGYPPAELLMCRKLKTKLPTLPTTLFPELQRKESIQKQKQRMTYNSRHAAKEASSLQTGNTVYIKDMEKSGTVIDNHHNPRLFIIQTDSGVIRRNRTHLVPTSENNSPADTTKMTSNSGCRSRSPQCSHSKSTTAPLQQPDLQSSPPASSPPPDVLPSPVQRNETPKRITNPTTVVTRAGRKVKEPKKLNL